MFLLFALIVGFVANFVADLIMGNELNLEFHAKTQMTLTSTDASIEAINKNYTKYFDKGSLIEEGNSTRKAS